MYNVIYIICYFVDRGLATGIYTTNNPEACQYVCHDANCNIVVVENDVQLQKILQVRFVLFVVLFYREIFLVKKLIYEFL